MSSLSRAQSWPLLSGAAPAEEVRNVKAKTSQIQARRLLCRHYYPEGGWGWVVAVCAVLVHIINHGFQISCSQLVSPAAFKFHVPKSYPAGYYWKDWNGSIPKDAFKAGRDTRGYVYIGQVYVPKTGIYVGQITSDQQEIFVSTVVDGGKPVKNSSYGLKILCTTENDLHWMLTNTTRTVQLVKNGGVQLVRGGVTIDENTIYIGKYNDKVDVFVGSVHGDWHDLYYFYYSTLAPLSGFSTHYEILITEHK